MQIEVIIGVDILLFNLLERKINLYILKSRKNFRHNIFITIFT